MKDQWYKLLFLLTVIATVESPAQKSYQLLSVPAIKAYTHIDMKDKSVLASGKYITPAGETIQITHDPFGMAIFP